MDGIRSLRRVMLVTFAWGVFFAVYGTGPLAVAGIAVAVVSAVLGFAGFWCNRPATKCNIPC